MSDPETLEQRHIFPFLSLPYEIRDEIYGLTLEYPDLGPLFERFEASVREAVEKQNDIKTPKCTIPAPRAPAMQTPGLLLVNRQIAVEAVKALHKKPFVLSRYAPFPGMLVRPMDITDFISEGTLRTMQFVVFRIDLFGHARGWYKTIEDLLDTWIEGNSLKGIEVWVNEEAKNGGKIYWEPRFEQSGLGTLSKIRNFAKAENIPLTGNMPEDRNIKKPE
ncbi:hypothetical protein F5Y04DRAFT_252395 [Hypomontagnella monticulosa]|nr:hypothetical protein F5Y04DRAFT_252395 [Hypomontagnella monticulosa]